MLSKDLNTRIGRLCDLSLEELRSHWRTEFGRKAPPGLPRSLLFRLFAYRLQANAIGDLSPATARALEQLIRRKHDGDAFANPFYQVRRQYDLKPGTILAREHGNVSHHVTVLEHGFAWNGQSYTSLSKVAKAITGTHWNGRRFFGLRKKGGKA